MASRKPVRTSMSSRGQACRFHMPTGETVGLAVQEMDSIRDIKARIWAKKKFAEPQVDYVFKLPVCEIVFSDLDTFDRLLELHDIFAEKGDGASTLVLSIHIIERANMGDKKARAEKRPTSEGPFEAQGVLYKRGRNKSSKYKRRFWVLENMTLYYYENEKAYFNGKEAIDFIPMGSCQAVRTDEVYKKRPFCFEIRASHIGKKDYSLWADSEEELTKWLTAIYKVNLRRVKAISVMVIEELTRRGLENQEGLFRVSGSKEVMWGLKRKFDEGEFPMLSNTMDTAAIAGLMKLSLRNLYEPVLTFALYDRFVRCADKPAETRVAAISDTVWALPPHVRGYVSYLFQFLHTVSKYSDRNLMTPKNLAIVFGPNLLRTEEDNMATAMQDTKNILATVQAMIENYETIWSSNVVEGEGDEAASDSDSDVSEASFAGQRDEATQQEYDQAAYEQWQRQQAEYERQQAEYERQQAAYDEWQRQQAEYERQQAEYAAQQAAYEQAPQQQAHHGYSASVVPTISDNSSSVAAAAAALAAQRKPRSYTTPETAPPPGLSKPASSGLPPAVAEENPGSESKPTLTRPTSGSTGQIDFDNKSTGQIDFRSTLKKSKPKPPKRPQEKEEDEEIPEWKREFLKRQQRKASGSSADSAPASGETADEGVADGSPTVVVTRLKTPSQPGRRRSSIRMPAPASKLITVEPARLFVCKKQQEDSIGNLRKRLGEKQKALDSAWVKVTTALALGGKPSRAMFESLEGHIARETRIGKQLLSIFDDVLHSVNALAGDIEENKRAADEAERERQEAQRRAEEAERLAEAVQEEEEFVPPPPRGRGPSVAPPPPSEEMAAKYKTCYASYEYEGGHREDELVFPEQARIIILDDSDADGWWFGRLADSGKEGWFPGNYVELE